MLSFRAGRAAITLVTPLIASLYGSSKLPTGDAGATDEPNSTIMAMLLSPLHVGIAYTQDADLAERAKAR